MQNIIAFLLFTKINNSFKFILSLLFASYHFCIYICIVNGWGLTKFCLLPNLKNMRNSKGKILFKPLLGAVVSTTVYTKDETFFCIYFF